MACDKIVGYTDFTAQQSISGMPTPEADLTHDIEGVDDCGKAGILMGQSSYNLVQQDLRDGIIRMPKENHPVGIKDYDIMTYDDVNEYTSLIDQLEDTKERLDEVLPSN